MFSGKEESATMDSAFDNAVKRFRESLTKRQREQFAHCSKQDVERTIQDIQAHHGSQKRLKYMRRVSKFIEGVSQLGQVVEVFLNVNNSVAFVWGPIKFILLAASTWVETLDLLLETYAEIGEALPGLSQYPKLFGSYPFIQKHLQNYYCDVLEFNRNALEVFARPGWKAVFHSSWKTFKSQFGPILSSFKRHQQLLTEEKLIALMSEVQTIRHHAEQKFQLLENEINARHARDSEKELAEVEESRHRQRRIVHRKLDAPDFRKDHDHASQMRQTSSSGDWILVDPRFQEWVELNTFSSKRFYLNGIPGAGKTILVSRIIDYLKDLQVESKSIGRNFSVIYFYFKHLHDNKRRLAHLLLALLSQLADQDSSLLDFLHREICSIDQPELSLRKLYDLASTALRAQRRCFIVVDGLDECAQNTIDNKFKEADTVLKWFEELMLPKAEVAPDAEDLCIRLLVSGQRDGHLEEKLGSYPYIQLETTAGHGEDIKSYAKIEASKICKQFSAGKDVEQELVQKVTAGAKGMFLFAKIVLDNLGDQISAFDFECELKAGNFPERLDEAYERVVKRVLKNPIKPERLAAEQILGWAISAERPLRWREIQSRFCIDPETGKANIQRQSVKSCKYLCGSLVEVGTMGVLGSPGSEGEVEMVHSSAKAYLIQTGAICLSAEHAKMALFCTQYLTSHPLRLSIEREIQACALTGYYGFHDYAIAFWWNHVDKLLNAPKEVNLARLHTYRETLHHVAKLLRAHLKPSVHDEEFEDLSAIARRFAELPRHPREREKVLSLEFATERVRSAIEAIRYRADKRNTADETIHLPLYGSIRYKCPKPWCKLFSTGFAELEQREDHVNEHERPFRCSIEGCYLGDIGFSTESGLTQHTKRHHTQPETALFPKLRQSSKGQGDICTAAKEGDLNSVKEMLANLGTDIDLVKRTPKGKRTPLMLAVEYGHLDVCKYLIDNCANVNFQATSNSETILHTAVRRDDLDIIDLLLKQDKIALHVKMQELTAPDLAAALGYNRSLSLFRDRKPREFDRMSCLCQAIQHDQIRTAQMLLKGPGATLHLAKSFIRTLSKASDDMLRFLLSLDGWDDNKSYNLLHGACHVGDFHLTRRLISLVDKPDSPDHTGSTPLEIAAEAGFDDIASMLLESGRVELRNLNTDKSSLLAKCATYDRGIIELFLKVDPSLIIQSDIEGTTLLHHAVFEGNIELVLFLLRKDVDVNAWLQSYPTKWPLSCCNADPASITPLRTALELGLYTLQHWKGLFVRPPKAWKVETFLLISQALVESDKVDLSDFECHEELQYLSLTAKLGAECLLWSLIKRGLMSSWGGPCCREDRVAQLMVVLKQDIDLLMAVATDKNLLGDTLSTLVGTVAPGKRRGSFLTLITANFRVAKKVFERSTLAVDATQLGENQLVLEEVVRQDDHYLMQTMIQRGFDGNIALLLVAQSGTVGMVEAILQMGVADRNVENNAGQSPLAIAHLHGNSAVFDRLNLKQDRKESAFRGTKAPQR